LFMLIALGMALYLITDALQIADGSLVSTIVDSGMSKWFFLDEFSTTGNHFIKHFLGGMFITIGMTGMDQDMMQKNLACKNIKQAQLNMMSFSAVLLVVNLLFLALGVLLYLYAAKFGIDVPKRTDLLFPEVALRSNLSTAMSVFFLLGLIAAAYSSADSALTSLTTSVCVDFLDIEKREKAKQIKLRKQAHVAMSVVLFFVIIVLHYTLDLTAIGQLIFLAGFTYGPLIGLFAFGLLTNKNTHPVAFPIIAVAAPLVTYLMVSNSEDWFDGFVFGALHIVFNSVLTFVLLWLASLPVFREARNSSEVLDR
ncbi:MAG: sodium:solute symporter, partial [Flavobacteriales bacterium]|nr:sodium:solute symporter [Flavobacteriales bacterium]